MKLVQAFLRKDNPCDFLPLHYCTEHLAKNVRHYDKEQGDEGHPCLTHCEMRSDLDCMPLTITVELAAAERALTRLINLGPKLMCCRSQYGKSHSILSKALQISSLKKIRARPDFKALCSSSFVSSTKWWMLLPGRKAL